MANTCINCKWCIFCESWGEYKCCLRHMRLNGSEATSCSDFVKQDKEIKDMDICHCDTCEDMRANGMIESEDE